jgi:hypothetical protein
MKTFIFSAAVVAIVLVQLVDLASSFSPLASVTVVPTTNTLLNHRLADTRLHERISEKRRKQLGIGEGEDEYDLGQALNNNTDPFISKLIAGSFILVMISLLVLGVIIPYTSDYGEGVCNPLLTAGRC